MRILLSFFVFISFNFINILAQKENFKNNRDAVETIKNLYTEHCIIWENHPITLPANILDSKLDSVAKYYCTDRFRKEAKEWSEDGNDFLTGDWGIIAESLRTLTIEPISSKENTYLVSYNTTLDDPPGKLTKVKVKLQVSVIRENDNYKVDNVKDISLK